MSKAAQELLGQMYGRTHGLSVVRVRPFAVIGPRKRRDSLSDFARGIIRVEQGEVAHLSVGNLEAVRDFVDVRDAVRAITLLTERGEAGEVYNLCTGIPRSLREMVEQLIEISGRSIPMVVDPARLRRADDPVLVGDPARLTRLGWRPEIPLRETLADILAFWRSQTLSAPAVHSRGGNGSV